MPDTKLMIETEWVQDLVESPEAPNMLATIKGLSSLCASVSLVLTSVEWMPSIPMSVAVGGSVALAAGTMWLNNRSKNKVIDSIRDDLLSLSQELARQVARGDALEKRLQKKDTTITSLLVMVQRAGVLDNSLGGADRAELDTLRKRVGAVSTLEEQVKSLQRKDEVAQSSKRRHQQELKEKSSQLKTAEEKAATAEESLDQVQKTLDDKTEALDKVENGLEIVQNDLYDSQQAVRSLEAANKSLQEQVESLTKFKTEYSEVSDRLQKKVGVLEVANQSLTSEAKIHKDSLNSSAAREQSLKSENQSLANMITSLNEAKTQDSELINRLQTRVSELEVAHSSVVSQNEKLKRDLDFSTDAERRLQNQVAAKETENAANQTSAWEQHKELLDEVNELKGQVTSLEKHKADSAALLKSAIDGENMAIFEKQDLLAQVKQLTAANQSLSSQVAALENNVAAASAALGSVNANTDGAAKPQDTSSADDDKPSADNKGPTAEPTDKQDEAPAKGDVDNAPVRKQAASKHTDNTRAQQLELRFNAKAVEYGALLIIKPINYAEVAEQCRGFGADKLDLLVAKS